MHGNMWAGVESKLEYSTFHLEKMSDAIQALARTQHNVALQASGAIIDTAWQRAFYAHFDAFLAAARSVPSVIEACFGKDCGNKQMRNWFNSLPATEQDCRKRFSKQFKAPRGKFDGLPLTNARNVSHHRTGFASVKVAIIGRFGVTHTGGPAEPVPISEAPSIAGEDSWMSVHHPVQPMPNDFTIDGRPLFDECKGYLANARQLMRDAQQIATTVHGAGSLTPPPR